MGVPSFFKWLQAKYPLILRQIVEGADSASDTTAVVAPDKAFGGGGDDGCMSTYAPTTATASTTNAARYANAVELCFDVTAAGFLSLPMLAVAKRRVQAARKKFGEGRRNEHFQN